jgi:hypothetical protein
MNNNLLLILPKRVQKKQSFFTSSLENEFPGNLARGDAIPLLEIGGLYESFF